MNPTPKSPELRKAQLAAFAAEKVEHFQDRTHIFKNLGDLALGEAQDVERVTETAEYHQDDGNKVRIPEGASRTAATSEAFTDFLRSVGGSNYEGIKGRERLLGAYSEYGEKIRLLRDELKNPATRKDHPNFLGSGSNAMVFSIDADGKKYAVRVPKGRAIQPAAIDGHLGGAVLGSGVPHLEQIVAASYEDGVTVAEMMPGKEVCDLTPEEISQVTEQQLEELIRTLEATHERGIGIDPKPSNLFYDFDAGYGLVDYHAMNEAGSDKEKRSIGDIVGWIATSLKNAGTYGKPYIANKTFEDYSQDVAFAKANSEVLGMYRDVAERMLEGDDLKEALRQIDRVIDASHDMITNPDWAAEQVASDKEWARRKAEQARLPQTDFADDFV